MDLQALDESLTVSAQISPADIPRLAEQGYRTLISNRPDGEEDGQPTAADLATAAEASGMEFVHIPVVAGAITDSDIEVFADAIKAAPGRAHAFCRTGTRSTTLWALAQASSLPVEEVLRKASRAGYDLTSVQLRLERRANPTPGP